MSEMALQCLTRPGPDIPYIDSSEEEEEEEGVPDVAKLLPPSSLQLWGQNIHIEKNRSLQDILGVDIAPKKIGAVVDPHDKATGWQGHCAVPAKQDEVRKPNNKLVVNKMVVGQPAPKAPVKNIETKVPDSNLPETQIRVGLHLPEIQSRVGLPERQEANVLAVKLVPEKKTTGRRKSSSLSPERTGGLRRRNSVKKALIRRIRNTFGGSSTSAGRAGREKGRSCSSQDKIDCSAPVSRKQSSASNRTIEDNISSGAASPSRSQGKDTKMIDKASQSGSIDSTGNTAGNARGNSSKDIRKLRFKEVEEPNSRMLIQEKKLNLNNISIAASRWKSHSLRAINSKAVIFHRSLQVGLVQNNLLFPAKEDCHGEGMDEDLCWDVQQVCHCQCHTMHITFSGPKL